MSEVGLDVGRAAAYAWFDRMVDATKLAPGVKATLKQIGRFADQYATYCARERVNPGDNRNLRNFLLSKGISMTTIFGTALDSQGLECAASIATLLKEAPDHLKYMRGGPVGIVAGFGLFLLNTLEVGNSCPIVQEVWFDAFLRESRVVVRRTTSATLVH